MDWLAQKFELARGGEAQNVRTMEGLRGYAVLLVFLVHYVTLVRPWLPPGSGIHDLAGFVHAAGNAGVDLFFVLSGYLIYGSLMSRRQPFRQFLSRRIERIYPAFIAVFAIYVGLSFALPAESKIPAAALEGTIYLLQNFLLLPGLFRIEPMITVAWSLSYEIFYYLAIPLLVAGFGLRSRGRAYRVWFFVAVAAGIAAHGAAGGGHVRLIMFVAGILLHEAIGGGAGATSRGRGGLAALVVSLVAMSIPVGGAEGATLKICLLFVAFFVLCLDCFRDPLSPLARIFSWTPLRWLGNASYSYYLLHGLTLKAAFFVLATVLPRDGMGAWFFWLLLPLMFALTLFSSAVLFVLVERPFSLVPQRIVLRTPVAKAA